MPLRSESGVFILTLYHSESLSAPQKDGQLGMIPNGTYQIVNIDTGAYAGLLDDSDRSQVVNFIPGLNGHSDRGTHVIQILFA